MSYSSYYSVGNKNDRDKQNASINIQNKQTSQKPLKPNLRAQQDITLKGAPHYGNAFSEQLQLSTEDFNGGVPE